MQERCPIYYDSYLQLKKVLNAQGPLSKSHDEHLFIIVHQVYELWFKQIAWEFSSIINIFKDSSVPEEALSKVVARLERIQNIQRLFPDQFEILETMTPMDFLEFRDLLLPASGFQSVQFRKVEILMGLKMTNRTAVDSHFFPGEMSKDDRKTLLELEKRPSLFDCIEKWLERMPFTKMKKFDFWKEYEQSIESLLKAEKNLIDSTSDQKAKQDLLKKLESTQATFHSLLKEKHHAELIKKGERRLSREASLNALFIMFFREEPVLAWPFKILHCLIGIDEHFTSWRYRHSLMAHRMLGTKIGTGGSSGHQYLKMTADEHRVFKDFFNLSTFLVPKHSLPEIPSQIKKEMGFIFEGKNP